MLRRILKHLSSIRRRTRTTDPPADPVDHRQFLLEMLPPNSVGAEIGVFQGDFSAQLLECVRPRELHLIDPWKYEVDKKYDRAWYGGMATNGQADMDARHLSVCQRFDDAIRNSQVVIHRAFSADTLGRFEEDYFDWVYIDGNHLYDFVMQDLILAIAKTKSNGYIAGDDYTEEGWWKGGVKKAVDEMAANPAVELIALRHRQFVFRKQ